MSIQQQRRLHFLFDPPGELKASSLKEPCFDLLYEAFSLSRVKDLIAHATTTSPLYPILPRPILQPQYEAPHSLIVCRLHCAPHGGILVGSSANFDLASGLSQCGSDPARNRQY